MEYVFLLAFVLCAVVGGFIYSTDPKGWNATAKRIGTGIRANLEAGKPIKALDPVKEKDDWEQKFKEIENPPSAALAPATRPKKHAIVKHTYTRGLHGDAWPQWVCKCGAKGQVPTGIWSDDETHRRAKAEGQAHVDRTNKADERLEHSKGNFAW